MENFSENSRLNALAENLNSGGIVVTINFAAHQTFNFFFVKQPQSVSCFHEWTGVDFVVRADNRWDSY